MKVSGEWIEAQETQAVCRMLEDAGYQALLVGGCVRNALIQQPVHDVDIATDAHPQTVMDLAARTGLKAVPTGIDHGTITVVAAHHPFEITTFRKDVETFGRHAVVAFATDVESDARRRDFTVNALYANRDGTVIDPLGGLADLQARRIRFIEDPATRIREDYLRILRFFRFHAWYGDPQAGLDPDGLAAAAELAEGLDHLSRERIGSEMLKLLSAPDPAPSVAAMRQSGILAHVLPGSDDTFLAPLVHIETLACRGPDGIRRLACLGGGDVADRLRLSKAQERRLALLEQEVSGTTTAEELGYLHGVEAGEDVILLRQALLGQPPDPEEFDKLRLGAGAVFPVRAKDLMPGLQGEALGRRLSELEDRWIASGFSLGREELLDR